MPPGGAAALLPRSRGTLAPWRLRGGLCCGICAALALCRGAARGGAPAAPTAPPPALRGVWAQAAFWASASADAAAPAELVAVSNATQVVQADVGAADASSGGVEWAAYYWWPLIFYMFYVMSVVCDDYLVPTVDAICDYFRIPEDVAGATLVAFACNGPELLTNVCGIFVTKTSVGMGTVVGSAIFNVLVITGACPMVSPLGKLRVCKKRFLRDVLFSAISIVMLWWALPVVDLFKASALFGMSAVYALVVAKSDAWLGPAGQETSALENALLDSGASSESEGCKPETCKPIVGAPFEGDKPLAGAPFAGDGAGQEAPGFAAARLVSALSDIASRPIDFVLALTVPDLKAYNVSVPRMLVAFFSSMAWLSGTAYVVCLGSDAINRHWGVPQAFLGLTLVAVGTSWPNLMASVVTARAGRGAIAVSNALGSNVQNVFLVLAGPIWVSVLLNGDYVADGADILASVLWMGITLAFVAAAVAFEGFRLTSMAGWSFMVLYAAYLVQATLLA